MRKFHSVTSRAQLVERVKIVAAKWYYNIFEKECVTTSWGKLRAQLASNTHVNVTLLATHPAPPKPSPTRTHPANQQNYLYEKTTKQTHFENILRLRTNMKIDFFWMVAKPCTCQAKLTLHFLLATPGKNTHFCYQKSKTTYFTCTKCKCWENMEKQMTFEATRDTRFAGICNIM